MIKPADMSCLLYSCPCRSLVLKANSRIAHNSPSSPHDFVAGVYADTMPLGAGQSKGDSEKGWGTPFSSFWCSYGAAVQGLARLQVQPQLPQAAVFYCINTAS